MKRPTCYRSFRYAVEGLCYGVKSQRSMKIHMTVAVLVIAAAWYVGLSDMELMILSVTIGMVMTAEMLNSAIEAVVDLVSPEYHPLAKIAKDVAAGAVLVAAITSIIVGVILFYERLFH